MRSKTQIVTIKVSTTFRNDNTDRFFRDVNAHDLISAQEEFDLVKAYKNGDMSARDKLISANLRFVISVAKQYATPDVPLQDLIQAGCIGLVVAIDKFDHMRGFKFISYAVWWIRQSILSELQNNGRTIRIPANIHGQNSKYRKETGNNMDVMNDTKVESLNRSAFDDGPEMIATIADVNSLAPDMFIFKRPAVHYLIDKLTPREQAVIKLRYGIGHPSEHSYEEISDMLGLELTRERVRQIADSAIRKLKRYAHKMNNPEILFELNG